MTRAILAAASRALRVLIFAAVIGLPAACGNPSGGLAEAPPASTPAVTATSDGAAASAPVAPVGAAPQSVPPPDSDADGVIDTADRCPDTPAGVQVDAAGCPVDADADGVAGEADLCPNSPYGEPVDATGCRPRLAVSQQYTLLLTFENDSATIIGDARAALAEVAALITQYPETTVAIEGHTDDRGPARYNMKMSQRRADAVASVLINDLGIDAGRVIAAGFGETKPISTNATKEGRARNRRVVAVVQPETDPHARADAAPGEVPNSK